MFSDLDSVDANMCKQEVAVGFRFNGPPAATTVNQACDQVSFSRDADRVMATCNSCDAMFFQLVEGKLITDALQLLPHIIPIRRAVWFASLCAWYGAGGRLSAEEDRTLGAVIRWTVEPTYDRQVAASEAGMTIGWENPTGRCVAAVERAGCTWEGSDQWSSANLPFAARLCAHAVLAAVEQSPEGKDVATTRLLALGVQIAMGRHLWNQ